jgi:hypothetical protein
MMPAEGEPVRTGSIYGIPRPDCAKTILQRHFHVTNSIVFYCFHNFSNDFSQKIRKNCVFAQSAPKQTSEQD